MNWKHIRQRLGSQEPFLLLDRKLWSSQISPTTIELKNNELIFTHRYSNKRELIELKAVWSFTYEKFYFFIDSASSSYYNGIMSLGETFLREDEFLENIFRMERSSSYSRQKNACEMSENEMLFIRGKLKA